MLFTLTFLVLRGINKTWHDIRILLDKGITYPRDIQKGSVT